MKELTLVIMAAGMGSRFGGLKQIEPVGPTGEFILDYSIYDAIKVGFNKVVFIIKEENLQIFKETIGKRIETKVAVQYVFQSVDNIPCDVIVDREKPWGTGHAIYCARKAIKGNFAVINADDFYGYDAFYQMSNFLQNANSEEMALVVYPIESTLANIGSVKRGICKTTNDYIESIIESSVEKIEGQIIASPLDGREKFSLESDSPASMSLFGFSPKFLEFLEKDIKVFLLNNENLKTTEYIITDVLDRLITNTSIKIKAIKTTANWHGVTYKEDKEKVSEAINQYIEQGIYPKSLW